VVAIFHKALQKVTMMQSILPIMRVYKSAKLKQYIK